jgi:hypothetical protein
MRPTPTAAAGLALIVFVAHAGSCSSLGPKFESPACENPTKGARFPNFDTAIAAEIAKYYADPDHL